MGLFDLSCCVSRSRQKKEGVFGVHALRARMFVRRINKGDVKVQEKIGGGQFGECS